MKNNMTEFKCIGLLNTQPPSFFESDSAVITVKDGKIELTTIHLLYYVCN